jgi:DNA-binding SARP family transcriptional activator
MNARKAHRIWIEQCEAAQTIKARFGLKAAFDYLVGEKLVNFVGAAAGHPDFARELPRFVSEVRHMFTPDEIGTHLARIERARSEQDADALEEEDDPLRESPAAAAERIRQFSLIKELLTATALGTS